MASTLSSTTLLSPHFGFCKKDTTKSSSSRYRYFRVSLSEPTMTLIAHILNFFHNIMFPIIPKTTQGFVAFLFWHSMATTLTTPLARLLSKTESWDGKISIPYLLNTIGLSKMLFGHNLNDIYLAYPKSARTDRAFGPHALFGILWIVMAYLHICHSKTLKKFIRPKYLAQLTAIAFMSHMFCSLRSLWLDPMEHHPLVKVMLFNTPVQAIELFISGVKEARNRNLKGHERTMIKCFLYSIEGAGTIRTVGYFVTNFGISPTYCQQYNGGLATSCVRPYVLQLMIVRVVTLYYQVVYAQMPGLTRKEQWRFYKDEVISLLVTGSLLSIIFSFDNAEDITVYAPALYVCSLTYTYAYPKLFGRNKKIFS